MSDGVSLGATAFARHETLLVVALSKISIHTGRPHAILIGAPSVGLFHSGASQAEKIKAALADHPSKLDEDVCQRRLVAVGGDGAVQAGGPAAKHKSTQAGLLVWKSFKDDDDKAFLEWDAFHRENITRKWAFRSVGLWVELYDLAAAMSQLFGIGQGRIVLRSTAAHIEAKALSVPSISGTRPTVSDHGAPGNLYANFRAYASSMHSRMDLARDGFGSQSLDKLVSIGRRLTVAWLSLAPFLRYSGIIVLGVHRL